MASGSKVLFLPRHYSGQANLLISDLPTPLAVDVFREFAAVHSTWIQVCDCMNLYIRVMTCIIGANVIDMPDNPMHALFR